MRPWFPAALALAACRPDAACGLGGAGGTSPDRDPIEHLANYDGPSFSELQDVEVDGDTVWFCSGVIGLNAYDASNPERLKRLDDIDVSLGDSTYPRCQHLALADDGSVYITNRGDAVQPQSFIAVVDGSDPSDLREVDGVLMTDEVEGIAVHGAHLLVAAHGSGLLVMDRADLSIRARIAEGLTNAWQVRTSGDIAWIADGAGGLSAVDVSEPEAPVVVGTLVLDGTAKDLEIDGDRAWVALGSSGVAAVDISDPSEPRLLDVADTPGSALGVAFSAKTDAVVVADWNDLRVFDVTDRDRLELRGHEPLRVQSDLESRTLGVATGRGDLIFSGNWTALSSYRYHPTRQSGDLDPSPAELTLPRTEAGDTTNALIAISNAGSRPLAIEGVKVKGRGLEVDLEPKTLKPGGSVTARVSWTAKGNGPLNGFFNLLSDDADEPKKCIPVSGNRNGLTVGDPVDASFVGLSGETFHTTDHRGQVVMLAYFATF